MQALRWTQRLLFASAAIPLGYCALVSADAWVFQHGESDNLDRLLKIPSVPRSAAVATQGLMGRLEIHRLGLFAMLMEGVDTRPFVARWVTFRVRHCRDVLAMSL